MKNLLWFLLLLLAVVEASARVNEESSSYFPSVQDEAVVARENEEASSYFASAQDEEHFNPVVDSSSSFETDNIFPVDQTEPVRDSDLQNVCREKCGTKCFRAAKIPVIRSLCDKSCMQRCKVSNSIQIYYCTISCARSMPRVFRSDIGKAEEYANYCYKKCVKN